MIAIGYITSLAYGIVCLLAALVLYKLGMEKKYTRKIVHILVGFEWVFLYSFMGAGIHFVIVCLLFLALLLVAYFAKLMPMISSDDDNSPGTVYYAVAMTGVAIVGCFVPEVMLPFGVGIFCTSVGDGFAGLFGQLITRSNPRIYGKKTLYGSIFNFVASFLSAFVMSAVFDMGLSVLDFLIIGLVSALYEIIVGRGLDNIAVTWGVTALTFAFMYWPAVYNFVIPIIMTPLVVIFAKNKSALTVSGLVSAIALDLVISISLGNFGFVLLLMFFVFGVCLDKVKGRIRGAVEEQAEKGSSRDAFQVLANGLVASLAAILFFASRDRAYIVLFVAALAEALADTAGSSIGVAAKRAFDPFRMKPCEAGLSGGMSLIGTLASFVGAAVIALSAFAFGLVNLVGMLVALVAGFLGSVIDSMLGSLVQVKYKCKVCGKVTEKERHCDLPTERISGFKVIDNDAVNLISNLSAALISFLVLFLV